MSRLGKGSEAATMVVPILRSYFRCSSLRSSITLLHRTRQPFCSETQHQASCSREDHAYTYQRPDDPERTRRPLFPHHQAEYQCDDAVEENPSRSRLTVILEVGDQVGNALKHEEDGQGQS